MDANPTDDEPFAFDRDECFGIRLRPGHSRWFGKDEAKRDEYLAELMSGPACQECGRHFETAYCEPTRSQMIQRQLCFRCNFWTNLHAQKSNHVFIGGNSYSIEKDLDTGTPKHCAGFGGREFAIRFNDGRVVKSRNLWHQGDIPAHFRERLPDTAVFAEVPDPIGHRQGYLK